MRQRFGALSTKVGLAGVGVLLLAFALTGAALAAGVHCPDCDQSHLSRDAYLAWKRYFAVKDAVYALATLTLALAMPLAAPRRWPFVFGFFLALLALAATPM